MLSVIRDKTSFNNYIYRCELWVKSTNATHLKMWSSILPYKFYLVGLPAEIKRFTLLRSPLGNKKSKEHYELRESGFYIRISSKQASAILSLLEVIRRPIGVKLKIKVSKTQQD